MSTPAPPGPVLGPCTSWIDGDDLAACCTVEGLSPEALAACAIEASMALYEISGRQFSGLCERVVRPCRTGCDCWGGTASGIGWYWGASSFGIYPGWWVDECGNRCGCGTLSEIKLAGYPVRDITEVKIGGEVVDPATYRLDKYRWLVRLDTPGPPVVTNQWPSCQQLTLDSDQPGTFEVSYRFGVDPPLLGMDAACQLACQLALSGCGARDCQLPAGVTRIVRQGVEIDRALLTGWLSNSITETGLVPLDTFLRAYGGAERRRRPSVMSPDLHFPRRTG